MVTYGQICLREWTAVENTKNSEAAKMMEILKTAYLFVGLRIYELTFTNSTNDDVAWEEQSLGEETEIPLRLVPGKETEELVEAIYKELEGEILDCNNCDIPVEIFSVEVIINIEVEFTQADQKILHMVI